MALYPDELKTVDTALSFLTQAAASPSAATESTLNNTHVEVVTQILERWPSSIRFPGEADDVLGRPLMLTDFIMWIRSHRFGAIAQRILPAGVLWSRTGIAVFPVITNRR